MTRVPVRVKRALKIKVFIDRRYSRIEGLPMHVFYLTRKAK